MDIYLAGCQGKSVTVNCFRMFHLVSDWKISGLCFLFTQALVVEQLERGGFFSDVITEGRVFATVHDAVLYCLKHRGAEIVHSYGNSLVSLPIYELINITFSYSMQYMEFLWNILMSYIHDFKCLILGYEWDPTMIEVIWFLLLLQAL